MARKRKSHKRSKPLERHKEEKIVCCKSKLYAPLVSAKRYYGLGESLGYAAAFLSLLALACFFLSGRAARPRILDSELIDRILHRPSNLSFELISLGSEDRVTHVRTKDKKELLLFRCDSQHAAGFVVSRNAINIPDDAQNVGLSLKYLYRGTPTINFGFTNARPARNTDGAALLATHTHVSMESPPNPNQLLPAVMMAPNYAEPDEFAVPWSQAQYFFMVVTSPVPTELYLDKMLFLEKR